MRTLAPAALASAAALAVGSMPALAAEYCVQCIGPAAVYRCATEGQASAGADPRLQLICASEMSRIGGHESCSVLRKPSSSCDGPLKTVAAPSGLSAAARSGDGEKPEGPDRVPANTESGPKRVAPQAALPAPPSSAAAGAGVPGGGKESQTSTDPITSAAPASETAARPSEANAQTQAQGQPSGGLTEDIGKAANTAGAAVADTAQSAGQMVGKAGAAAGKAAKKGWNCVTSLFSDC